MFFSDQTTNGLLQLSFDKDKCFYLIGLGYKSISTVLIFASYTEKKLFFFYFFSDCTLSRATGGGYRERGGAVLPSPHHWNW